MKLFSAANAIHYEPMFLWYSKESIDLSYKFIDLFYILKCIFYDFISNSSAMESISSDKQQCKAKCFKKDRLKTFIEAFY